MVLLFVVCCSLCVAVVSCGLLFVIGLLFVAVSCLFSLLVSCAGCRYLLLFLLYVVCCCLMQCVVCGCSLVVFDVCCCLLLFVCCVRFANICCCLLFVVCVLMCVVRCLLCVVCCLSVFIHGVGCLCVLLLLVV